MHSPPPFVPADIRISPSGPYVNPPGGGGIIRFGADAIIGPATLTDTGVALLPLPRSSGPLVPLAVTFPAWRDGDTLWIVWHLSGLWVPGSTANESAALDIFPTVDVGGGPQLINNASVISFPNFVVLGGEVTQTQGFSLAGTAAIRIDNPAQPPIVQLFYLLADLVGGVEAHIAGIAPTDTLPGPGSGWLTCAELTQEVVFQLPPEVILSPIP
jgi:hypothetical protein